MAHGLTLAALSPAFSTDGLRIVASGVVSIALTVALMSVARANHAPACATPLIVSLGVLPGLVGRRADHGRRDRHVPDAPPGDVGGQEKQTPLANFLVKRRWSSFGRSGMPPPESCVLLLATACCRGTCLSACCLLQRHRIGYNPARGEVRMNQELVERLRDLAVEMEQSEGDILFVSTDEKAIVEAAKALAEGGKVSHKVVGTLLYYVADMAEE